MPSDASRASQHRGKNAGHGQVTLVLQGGGALGAYQGGVYQALHERGMEPDWVIGTSIGAVNASLIAGNAPERRLDALRAFWARVKQEPETVPYAPPPWPFLANPFVTPGTLSVFLYGVPGFFEPNMPVFLGGQQASVGVAQAGFYSARPLKQTLTELIDLELLNKNAPRITVGATEVRHGIMKYFDSAKKPLGIEHIMASGALPPAFPAVEADGEYYWDGGILSNTPIEAVFDDGRRQSGLVFAVEVWNRQGANPDSIVQVLNREKDIQYAARTEYQIKRQKQIHKLRNIIHELAAHLGEEKRHDHAIGELVSYGCSTQMHVMLVQARPLKNETYLKDIDFSPDGIRARWDAGYADTNRILDRAPWLDPCDPLGGVILHDFPKEPSVEM